MGQITAAQLGLQQQTLLPTNLSKQADKEEVTLSAAEDLKKAFSQFVGETFYGTMLKSMRKTVQEPAYFHGGQAEEMFQGQLDQEIVADMAASGSNNLAESLFKNQFPEEAELLEQHANKSKNNDKVSSPLDVLSQLPQR